MEQLSAGPSHQLNRNHQSQQYYFVEDSRKVFDPVHGFIRFHKDVWKVIDTPEFQRLRQIKQLGLLYLVFPSAMHTRFEHCIGTAYLCQKYMEKLILNNEKYYNNPEKAAESKIRVTLAGLLHDIGHGPFSHMFDNEFMGSKKASEQKAQSSQPDKPKWSHEYAGLCIIDYLATKPELQDVLTPARVERIKRLIDGKLPKGEVDNIWQYEIVSNKKTGIDVDRFDYFRRDSFYLGIHNVYVDYELLMDETRIIEDNKEMIPRIVGDKTQLVPRERLCYPVKYADKVLDIFHSRYKLFKGYYQNKIVKGIEIMLCEMFSVISDYYGIRDACNKIKEDPQNYCRLTDNIIYEVLRSTDPKLRQARQIMTNIQARKVYKFVLDVDDIDVQENSAKEFIKKSDEDIVASIIECSEGSLKKDDIAVCVGYIDLGSKKEHPIDNVRFYRKNQKPYKICQVNANKLSILKTTHAQQRFVRLYVKDSKNFASAKRAFLQACRLSNLKPGPHDGTPSLHQQDKSTSELGRRDMRTLKRTQ